MSEPQKPAMPPSPDAGSPTASSVERRLADRRQTGRRHEARASADRRKSHRRKRVAGAGILAAITIAGSFPRLHHPSSAQPAPAGPASSETATQPPPEKRASDSVLAKIDQIIDEASATYGVNPDFVRAIIQAESRFNPRAVSHVGAQGLMQLMPMTARYLGVSDPFDMRQNVFAGVKYLSTLLDRFEGNVALAAAAYNAGPNAVARHRGIPPYRETRGYVKKVKGYLEAPAELPGRTDTRSAD